MLTIDISRKKWYNSVMRKIPDSKEDKILKCSKCGKDTKVSSTATSVLCWYCVGKAQQDLNDDSINIFDDKEPGTPGRVA